MDDLSVLLKAECVAVNVAAASKADALAKLAALAKNSPELGGATEEEIRLAMERRESVGSTGFGKGIAIPHCRMDSVSSFVVGLATVSGGVDFDSLDGKPVRLVAFIIGPSLESTEHIRILSGLSRVLSQEGAVREMLAAPTPEALRESFLRHVPLDGEPVSETKRSLLHVFVQDEALFEEILQVLGGTEPRFTAVLDAENASAYLAKMPLFAGLWTDAPRSFTRVIISLVNRSMVNEMVRRIEQVAGPLSESERVLVTVQNTFFSGGSLTT